MNILALESSTKDFSLAIFAENKIRAYRHIRLKQLLSSSIIPAIRDILKQCQLSLEDINGYAIGLGPGSFTSLRVGLSTIKGLAFASSKPVVGVSSLDALALNVPSQETRMICTLNDARRNLLYVCFYLYHNKKLIRQSDYQLIPLDDLISQVVGETLFIGDGISLYGEKIEQQLNRGKKIKAFFAKEKDGFARADRLAYLARERFFKKDYDDISRLVPLYLYPEDCQIGK